MCKMIAVPPNTDKDLFIDLVKDIEERNKHGFGIGFVKDGVFCIKKTGMSFSDTLKKRKDFFDDIFPNKSWLLGHCRYATRGSVCAKNSHPFPSDKLMLTHNGTFKEQELVKFLLEKANKIKFTSDTDSEVVLKLLETLGPKRFVKYTRNAGVVLALTRKGKLWALKSEYSDDLAIAQVNDKNKHKPLKERQSFLISRLGWDSKYPHEEAKPGWYLFDEKGFLVSHNEKNEKSFYTPYSSCSARDLNTPSHVSTVNQELEEFRRNQGYPNQFGYY